MHRSEPAAFSLVLLALSLFGCTVFDDGQGCDDCNVIVITFDALGADHLGFAGNERDTSPNLDAFASEAFVFSDALSQSGTTVPSLASLWTSRFPFSDRIVVSGPALDDVTPNLAEMLSSQGYDTAAVIAHIYARSRFGHARGFAQFDEDYIDHESSLMTRDRALAMLRKLKEPFFLWVHIRQPHSPYEPDLEVFRRYHPPVPGEPEIPVVGRKAAYAYFHGVEEGKSYRIHGKRRPLTPTMVKQYSAMYDGNVRRGDEGFGRFMEDIEAEGFADNTMVIVAADHGECVGEHRRVDHNELYHGITHTPLLVRMPSRRHEVRDYPVMNVDIVPTILSVLGLPVLPNMRGKSLFDEDRSDYFQFAEYGDQKILKVANYKVRLKMEDDEHRVDLYDLDADPLEANDLSEEEPERTARMLERLSFTTVSSESVTMEELRALGYIE